MRRMRRAPFARRMPERAILSPRPGESAKYGAGRRGGRRRGGDQVSGFGRIVLLGAIVATVAGIAGLRAQTQLADPKDAPKIFASTCSACHKSPQGLAKSGQVAGFLRQHYTTGPEMSAAMAAYLVAAGSAPGRRRIGRRRRGRPATIRRPRARARSRSRPRRQPGADAKDRTQRCAASSCRRSRRTTAARNRAAGPSVSRVGRRRRGPPGDCGRSDRGGRRSTPRPRQPEPAAAAAR